MSALATTLILVLAVAIFALWINPPDLLRVGANYTAKTVCSNVFLAGRDPDEVLHTDVQSPGIALLRLMQVTVDRQEKVVHAGLLGFIGHGLALARPTTGCAAIPDGNIEYAKRVDALTTASATTASSVTATVAPRAPAASLAITAAGNATPQSATTAATAATAPWPDGDAGDASNSVTTDATLDRVIADDTLAGPGMRAIVVIDHGRLVAERYSSGFSATTPLLGWSMTKSVLAGLVGIFIKEGQLTLDQSAGWSDAGDARDSIHIADLLSMTSGLRFNEAYGAVSDVTRMLYLEPNAAGFASDQPLQHPPGKFWSYSSGSANILSRIVQDAAGKLGATVARAKLFDPLGMTTATIETDEDGTLVGSSYMYATARDWARYGQFLLQKGVWQGQELLPAGYVAMMATPVAPSGGQYGHGLVWLWGSHALVPGKNPDTAFGIPADSFWMEGHDGQYIAIIPSRQLVIVRLGLTPRRDHYQPQPLVKAVLDTAS
jgi:CubicO group peptidase (beta-lactamase class C family)